MTVAKELGGPMSWFFKLVGLLRTQDIGAGVNCRVCNRYLLSLGNKTLYLRILNMFTLELNNHFTAYDLGRSKGIFSHLHRFEKLRKIDYL